MNVNGMPAPHLYKKKPKLQITGICKRYILKLILFKLSNNLKFSMFLLLHITNKPSIDAAKNIFMLSVNLLKSSMFFVNFIQ